LSTRTIAPTPSPGERLAKRVAALMRCSRREAEQYIAGGWVSVDGQMVEEPMFRVSDQSIKVDPEANLLELQAVTLLLHKPVGYDAMATPGQSNRQVKPAHSLLSLASHAKDDTAKHCVLKHHLAKLTACVPLEAAASGLVVFTQDWRVSRKLREDVDLLEQELIVEVSGSVPPDSLQRLNQGLTFEGRALPLVKVSLNSTGDTNSKLRFAIKGSHPGLIAHLCERVGLEIASIKRIRIGRVAMAHVAPGQWRYLQTHERF
jgi:23S rRNA pseudouridine2604 synthase